LDPFRIRCMLLQSRKTPTRRHPAAALALHNYTTHKELQVSQLTVINDNDTHNTAFAVNIPQMLVDHCNPSIHKLDREIDALANKLAKLVMERTVVETHERIQQAINRRLGG
jgi:hypothetical protein